MPNENVIVYMRTKLIHGIKDEHIKWIGPFNKGMLELASFEVVEERHNGSNEYVIQQKYRVT